ncbi:acetylcholinesterase-like [Haemaphysalis longicornis]
MWTTSAFVIAATCVAANKAETSGKVVTTASGAIQGIVRATTTGSVNAFLGVPFAEPPIGDLRFKKPIPKNRWEGVLNATALPPLCPQTPAQFNSFFKITASDAVSEDCLFLNVFSPARSDPDLKPVVVYFHGGAFTYGGISMKIFDPSELAVRGDLVVVVVAYRLGALGFLHMGVEEAPGNVGLYDQLLALRWVRDNARAFGGDADKVTIMGESVGSISVAIHLVWPKSEGLFRRAFMQSGSPLGTHFIMNKTQATRKANAIVTYFNCDKSEDGSRRLDTEDVVACLRSKDFRDILKATASFNPTGLDGFLPLTGEEFLTGEPGEALAGVTLNAREVLVSVCEAEGDFFVHYLLSQAQILSELSLLTKQQMEMLMKVVVTAVTSADLSRIVEHYFDRVTSNNGKEVAYAASDLIGDLLFVCPTLEFAKGLTSGQRASVHAFVFSHKLSFAGWPEWMRPTHADDIVFTLGSALSEDIIPTDADVEAIEKFINVISTFSRTGVPQAINGTNWPKFNEDEQYLRIADGPAVLGTHFRQASCDFLNRILRYERKHRGFYSSASEKKFEDEL